MGLFSRNESATDTGRRSTSRNTLSSEAQANELRGRARRRLIGALALVLAAVIIVPMMFDSSTPAEDAGSPVVIPAVVPPESETNVALAPTDTDPAGGAIEQEPTEIAPEEGGATQPSAPVPANPPAAATTPETPAAQPSRPDPEPKPAAQPAPEPAAKPEPKPEPKPKPQPKPADERTDDGSVAIALLEGRSPAASKPAPAASKGNFILQIAAYTTETDANARRDRLVSAGVTNTYVQQATSGGKPTYRLRVGPFPSREAAQAAQARLRALGYDNGFISAQ